ncbi:hypothetical protein [Moorena producens]|uniref:hypothetical protein n=1 Tax=Moorena producens TaxID=1155739 RepID=UPI003C785B28
MSSNGSLTEWLAQIKELKQQLADSIKECQAADKSAAHWRQLYNTEAQQRRIESQLAQEQIETLKGQLQKLQQDGFQLKSDQLETVSSIDENVEQLQTVEELRATLKSVMAERDRLIDALKTEQANHAQTRENLTVVISDTVEQLAKERKSEPSQVEDVTVSESTPSPQSTPSPHLPSFDNEDSW